MKKQPTNGSRLEESTILLQQAMAGLLQNQVLIVGRIDSLSVRIDSLSVRMDGLSGRMDRLEEKLDKKFADIDRRFEHVESLMSKMFAELPERVFGFAQAAAKKPPE